MRLKSIRGMASATVAAALLLSYMFGLTTSFGDEPSRLSRLFRLGGSVLEFELEFSLGVGFVLDDSGSELCRSAGVEHSAVDLAWVVLFDDLAEDYAQAARQPSDHRGRPAGHADLARPVG